MPLPFARFLALVGAAAMLGGVWFAWIDDVTAAHIPIRRLFGWNMKDTTGNFVASIGLIIVVAAVIAILSVLLPSRAAAFVSGIVGVGVIALLLIQEYRYWPHHLNSVSLGAGLWCSLVGCIVLVLGSLGLDRELQRDVVQF